MEIWRRGWLGHAMEGGGPWLLTATTTEEIGQGGGYDHAEGARGVSRWSCGGLEAAEGGGGAWRISPEAVR